MRRTNLVVQRLKANGKNKARVALCGDWHLGANNCDEKALDEFLKMCVKEKIYMIGMGDQLEMASRYSVGSGVYEQDAPDSQIEAVVEKLKPLHDAGLLIGVHTGNHEERISKAVGINITKLICQSIGTRYLNHSAQHLLQVNKQSYVFFTTHGSSGARLPYTKVKGALDIYRYVDAEVVCMGHTHGLDHMTQLFQMVDKRRKKIDHKVRHAVLTGSYLLYSGSYAEKKNLPPVPIGSPIVTLYGDRHEIRVSL